MPTPESVELLNERQGHTMDPVEAAHYKESQFERYIRQVMPIEPIVDVSRQYDGKLPMAVATGGMRHICHKTLDVLKLREKFAAIVTAEDVTNGKPAPDIYLEAARRLGVEPTLCMAFEDATPGVQSSTAAGMLVGDVRKLPT